MRRPNIRRWRGLAIAALLWLASGAAIGCAGPQATDEDDRTVQGDKPTGQEAEPEPMPGPSVSVDEVADSEDDSDEGGADSEADGAEQDNDKKQFDTPPPEDAEVVQRSEVRNLLARGPAYILQSVRVEPYREGGAFQGYEIVDGSSAAFEVLDPQMEVGDVVVAINDVTIEKPNDYLRVWKSLNRVDRVQIDYVRDGQEKSAVWVIREGGEQ